LKYAIPEGDAANITVSFQQREGIIELLFQDDGPGFPEALLQNHQVAGKSTSIGMSLMKGLVTRNLRGKLSLQNNNGAMARITFPAMMTAEKNLFEGETK
jgi:two-component sensor histidine kinase